MILISSPGKEQRELPLLSFEKPYNQRLCRKEASLTGFKGICQQPLNDGISQEEVLHLGNLTEAQWIYQKK